MQRYFCQLTCLYVFNIESLNIKTRGRLQITLFLTDACSQPIAGIERAMGRMAVEGLFPETHVLLRNVERLGMIT